MSNCTSLSSPDDIQAMLENVSSPAPSPFASATPTSRPGESSSFFDNSKGGSACVNCGIEAACERRGS